MPYADKEKRRECVKAHYERNKHGYNPSRSLARLLGSKARGQILEESKSGWVSPERMNEICYEVAGPKDLGRGNVNILRQLAYGYVPGAAEGGMLLGSSPFMPPPKYGPKVKNSVPDEWARDEFLRRLKTASAKGCRIELLILEITLKRIKLYGR